MEEIKFRLWSKSNNKFMSPAYIFINFEGILSINQTFVMIEDSGIVTQFTGRKDEDNVEIYEEDIIECDYDDFWDPFGNGYPTNKKYRFIMKGKNFFDFPDMPNRVKVIGNKFEDPKLYKEVKQKEEL